MAEAALDIGFMSVEEYLARENDGDWKHEFVNGAVYAMVGTSDRHNLIAGELYAALLAHLPPQSALRNRSEGPDLPWSG